MTRHHATPGERVVAGFASGDPEFPFVHAVCTVADPAYAPDGRVRVVGPITGRVVRVNADGVRPWDIYREFVSYAQAALSEGRQVDPAEIADMLLEDGAAGPDIDRAIARWHEEHDA